MPNAYILELVQILVCLLTIHMTVYKFLGHTMPHSPYLLNSSKTVCMANRYSEKSTFNYTRILFPPECLRAEVEFDM